MKNNRLKPATAQTAINYEEALQLVSETTNSCIADIMDRKIKKMLTKQLATNKAMFGQRSPIEQFKTSIVPDSKVVVLTKDVNIAGKGLCSVEDNFLICDFDVAKTHTLQSIKLVQLTGDDAGRIYSGKEMSYRTFKNKTSMTYEVQIGCKDYFGKFSNRFSKQYFETSQTCELYCDGFVRTFYDVNKVEIDSFYPMENLRTYVAEKEYSQDIFDDFFKKCAEEKLKKEKEEEKRRQFGIQKQLQEQKNKEEKDVRQLPVMSKEAEENMFNYLIQFDPYQKNDPQIEQ